MYSEGSMHGLEQPAWKTSALAAIYIQATAYMHAIMKPLQVCIVLMMIVFINNINSVFYNYVQILLFF